MSRSARAEITEILTRLGDDPASKELVDQLFSAVSSELNRLAAGLMRGEATDHTLQPTALVNEAYLRLVDSDSISVHGRTHFFGIAARAMRHVLVDHARRKGAIKRGGQFQQISLSGIIDEAPGSIVDLVDLDRALHGLAELDRRMADVVTLRFFSGLTMEEIAGILDVTRRTVQNDWRVARSWLLRELKKDPDP